MYESSGSISITSPILLAMIVRAFVFLNCLWRSGNWAFIVCESKVLAPCILASKFGMYRKKERFKPFHSTIVIFLANLTPFSFVKSTSKKLLVNKVTDVYEVGRCSLRQSWRAFIVGLSPRVLSITILRALRTTPSYISSTISSGKSASNFKS